MCGGVAANSEICRVKPDGGDNSNTYNIKPNNTDFYLMRKTTMISTVLALALATFSAGAQNGPVKAWGGDY